MAEKSVRDWIYVLDHREALRLVLERGAPGEYATFRLGVSMKASRLLGGC
jgi:dTDP-D-glucose 4,6-dehydratase